EVAKTVYWKTSVAPWLRGFVTMTVLSTGLRDPRRRGLLRGRGFKMVRDQVRVQSRERFGGRVDAVHQPEIVVGNRAPFGHRPEIEHMLPVVAAVQNDFDRLRQLVGLDE